MTERLGQAGFLDVETTGLDELEDEIIELAIVVFRFDRDTGEIIDIIGEYTGLREPDVPIKRRASEVNGIYRRHVKGKKLDNQRIVSLLEYCEFLIAHNAEFDKGFFDQYLKIRRDPPFSWYCTMKGIDWNKRRIKRRSLQNLLLRHNIEITQTHRALDDCKAALQLLQAKNKQGDYYLKELLSNPPLFDGLKYKYHPARALEEVAASATYKQDENHPKTHNPNIEEKSSYAKNKPDQKLTYSQVYKDEKEESRKRIKRIVIIVSWIIIISTIVSQCTS